MQPGFRSLFAADILAEHFEGVEVEGYFFFFLINQLIPYTIQSAFNPRHAKIHELCQATTNSPHVQTAHVEKYDRYILCSKIRRLRQPHQQVVTGKSIFGIQMKTFHINVFTQKAIQCFEIAQWLILVCWSLTSLRGPYW
ncbi:hypothetical protein BJN42_17435 [Pseudomonas koreensis]|nr:hypothetical protein BJN42_17435 [Pseudomonas koreensis]